jgi:hypothetical protein
MRALEKGFPGDKKGVWRQAPARRLISSLNWLTAADSKAPNRFLLS